MRRIMTTALIGFLLTLHAPFAAAADQSEGPYAGTVRSGEVDALWYQNFKSGFACLDLPAWAEPYRPYTFTLTYAPTTDTLRLTVGGFTASGANGIARITYVGYICQQGYVYVEGLSVLHTAGYVLTVVKGPQEGTLPECSDIC